MSAKFSASKAFVTLLLTYTPADSTMALMTFADKVEGRLGFDHSRQEMMQVVSLLDTRAYQVKTGRTALFDAINEAVAMLSPPGPNDVIYVVSDGGDNRSKTDPGKLERTLLSAGIRLYGILPLDLNPPTQEEILGPTELGGLAEHTGGVAVPYYGPIDQSKQGQEQRLALVRNLVTQAFESYRLEIELPQAPDKRRGWTLEVADLPRVKGGTHVAYPRDLMPCSDSTPKN